MVNVATMNWHSILSAVLLTVAYGGIMAGLVWLLRRAGAPARWAIVLGFAIFGVASGLLAAWAWPYDSCVLPNLWAVLLGDALYGLSAEAAVDLVFLRVPWVYPLAGAMLFGLVGLVAQALANRRQTGDAQGGQGRSVRA